MEKFLDQELKGMTVLNERLSLASALNQGREEELDLLADAIADSVQAE